MNKRDHNKVRSQFLFTRSCKVFCVIFSSEILKCRGAKPQKVKIHKNKTMLKYGKLKDSDL